MKKMKLQIQVHQPIDPNANKLPSTAERTGEKKKKKKKKKKKTSVK